MNFEQIADVLEKTAAYLDALEATREETVANDREKLASILKDRFEEVTGDSLDDDAFRKLAQADLDVLSAFDKLVENHTASSDLGGPSDRRDHSATLTVKEAAEKADEDFLNFLLS